ncbi:HTH-type transcriptional activator IlvY [Shewanella submarina]|uniref:HTH-type transcriptional activator IlvY n=1 Tax=Shewanella submarina TaxID=2016376 RepID=A0ABV7GGD3_9GAMM|nr:HTH-type transcriptional activator IlvY [Shewanella submarina]MCL1039475.1 HTH-type transcriptional activator IlvY [Shewanella submarina]
MDIRSLQLYLHLCDSLNFSRTAEQMHMSPSTLSRALQRLEQQVGSSLMERDNRSVALTRAGREFQQFARETVEQWQELKGRLDPRAQLKGKLNLYCSVTAAYSHLPNLLDKFRQEQPQVEINLITGDAANAVTEVQQGRADIAIAARPDNLPNSLFFSAIDTVPLHLSVPVVPCHARALLQQKPIPWEQLPFIVPDHGPARRRCDAWFRQMGIRPTIYAQASGHEAITSMVALGCGISILPSAVLDNSPVRDRIELLDSPVPIEPFVLGCCCKKQRTDDGIISAFFNIIT